MKNINIYAFADEASHDIDKQIIAMKRNGLKGLEIRNVDGVNVSDISLERAKEVSAKLSDAGLSVWSVGSPIGKIDIEKDDYKAHIEKLKHTLEVGNILNAENIRLFSFYIPKEKDADSFENEVINRLGEMAEICAVAGIAPCHENEKGIYGDITERCLKIYEALPLIQGIFDPANFVQCGVNTETAWKMLKPYIKYLHIKDAETDGTVVPSGEGAGNVKQIIESFVSFGGKNVTVEPHLTVFDGLSGLEREGEETKIRRFVYADSDSAFDAACDALKKLL